MPSSGQSMKSGAGFYNRNWFTHGCELATKLIGKDRGKKKTQYDEKRDKEFESAKKKFEKAKAKFKEAKKKFQKTDELYWDEENRFNLCQDIFIAAKIKYEKHELNFSLKYLRYDIEPYQVPIFSNFALMVLFPFLLFIDSVILALLNFLGYEISNLIMFVIALVTLLTPPIIASMILRYPMNKARKVQVKTLGRLPETINYMSMSMYLNPSLNTAIEFASDNVDEPLSTNLKKILWNVYIREFDSIEESFLDFAFFCGEFSEEFKRALYNIRNAAIEKTKEGIHRALDTANDVILEGTKRQMEGFANSLTGPTMVLFSLGIMLPMIVGALLPLLQVGANSLPMIIILMDILFPGVTFLYAFHILGNRPGTSVPPMIPNPLSRKKSNLIIATSISIFVLGLILSILWMRSLTEDSDALIRSLTPLPVIWGAGMAVVNYSHRTSKHQKRKREVVMKMEDEFPDALYHLGSRIAEGKAFEDSLRSTSKTLEGTHIGRLYRQMFYNLQVVRSTLKDALFGPMGILSDLPSRTIRATMGTVIESIKKDASTAGATIIKISRYLRDLKSVEKEIDNNLSGIRSMMLTTGSVFGPLIMGITTALYLMLTENIGDIGPITSNETASMAGIGAFELGFGDSAPIPAEIFSLIIGIYLLFTALIIIYFCTNIRYGDDKVEVKVAFARTLPVTLVVFTLTVVVANMLLV